MLIPTEQSLMVGACIQLQASQLQIDQSFKAQDIFICYLYQPIKKNQSWALGPIVILYHLILITLCPLSFSYST